MADLDIATVIKNLFESIRHQARRTHSGIVLTTVAVLDNQLELALKKTMRPLSKKLYEQLFGPFRPLSTFSSKIVMARALGIITTDIYTELEKIRRIRNEFAHSSKLLNFESDEIAPKLLALKKRQPIKTNPSMQFLDCVVVINEFLGAYLVRMGEPQEKDKSPA
jgi:DNA-binding MltR family transcriptional regulator